MNTSNEPILLFDGVCNICDQAVQFVIRYDKRGTFKFASLQSDAGQHLLKKYNLPTENFDSFVLISNNKCYQKSTAALHVCRGLGGRWKILYALIAIPKPLRDGLYNLIAKNRYKWFGKKDHCILPSPEIRKRFL